MDITLDSKYSPELQHFEFIPYKNGDAKYVYYNIYQSGVTKVINYTGETLPSGFSISGHLMTYISLE